MSSESVIRCASGIRFPTGRAVSTAGWAKDFGNGTAQEHYIRPSSPVSFLPLAEADVTVLSDHDVHTVAELADLSKDAVRGCKHRPFRAWASSHRAGQTHFVPV